VILAITQNGIFAKGPHHRLSHHGLTLFVFWRQNTVFVR
jgi:hypothetical protein